MSANREIPAGLVQRLRAVRMVVFDVDGVLTDGRLILGDDGQEYKAFNAKDGHGMRMLIESDVQIAILTGRNSRVVERRAADLGIELIIQGRRDKLPAFEELLAKTGLKADQTAYAGDDIVDLPVMRRVGLAAAVADASPLVRQHAHWTSRCKGGQGAARELCELIMQAQGTLEDRLARYLR